MAQLHRILPAAVLVIGVLAAMPDSAQAAASAWIAVASQHVAGQNERPLAVVSPAPGDVWAIGYSYGVVGGAAEFRALAEHYNGRSFVTTATPDRETAPAQDFLNGAAAPASNDVWAVGTSVGSGSRRDQTLIEHWNGSAWSIVTSPNPGANGNDLQAAASTSSTDVWAVGARTDTGSFYQSPMILHWNGTAWSSVATPTVPGCTGHSYLTAVSAVTTGLAWATGWCGSGGSAAERGYVLRWNGRVWSLATVIAQQTAPQSETYGITATGNRNVWLVGTYQPASGSTAALTYHWDGSTWSLKSTPSDITSLAGVTAGSRGVWAVGDGTSPQPPFAGPGAATNPAAGWVDESIATQFGHLTAVTTTPDRMLWAVGSQILSSGQDTALLLHRPALHQDAS